MNHLINTDPVTGTVFMDSEAESGTDYIYAVQAYSSGEGYSAMSTANAVEISIP